MEAEGQDIFNNASMRSEDQIRVPSKLLQASRERQDRIKKMAKSRITSSSDEESSRPQRNLPKPTSASNTVHVSPKPERLSNVIAKNLSDTSSPGKWKSKGKTLQTITAIQEKRDNRRKAMEKALRQKDGVDPQILERQAFIRLIEQWRQESADTIPEKRSSNDLGGIQVCVRKRPITDSESETDFDILTCDPQSSSITLHEPRHKLDGSIGISNHTFSLDHVYPSNYSTLQIYKGTLAPLVNDIFSGILKKKPRDKRQTRLNLFAYGQTGSGKTFTMFGDSSSGVKGLYHYVCQDIAKSIMAYNASKNTGGSVGIEPENVEMRVTFYEIYLGKIHDLLQGRKKLQLMEDRNGQTSIPGLKSAIVTSLDDLELILEIGMTARKTSATSANDVSSRSHAILQITISNMVALSSSDAQSNLAMSASSLEAAPAGSVKETRTSRTRKKTSQGCQTLVFSLIDLAGSERASRMMPGTAVNDVPPLQRQESSEINKSLLALKECIRALHRSVTAGSGGGKSGSIPTSHRSSASSLNISSGYSPNINGSAVAGSGHGNDYIPFRASKLTQVLRDCLTEKGRTVMLVTVAPASKDSDHSMNTLRYADRVKEYHANGQGVSQSEPIPMPDKNEEETLQKFKSFSLQDGDGEDEMIFASLPEERDKFLDPDDGDDERDNDEDQQDENVDGHNYLITGADDAETPIAIPSPLLTTKSSPQPNSTTSESENSDNLLRSLLLQTILDTRCMVDLEQTMLSGNIIDGNSVNQLESLLIRKIESFKVLRDEIDHDGGNK